MYFYLIFLIIFGYLLGSISFGYLICKIKGVDIRKLDSGNIGGVNVIRVLGIKWGLLMIILDALKGVVPVYFALNFLVFDWQITSVFIASVLGHIFPAWLNFKGGKGVATTLRVLILFFEWKILLLFLFIWSLVLAIFQIFGFSNLLMVSFLPLALWLSSFSLAYFILGFILFVLIWWVYQENLQRKLNRELSQKLN